MNFHVLTLFPEMVLNGLNTSITGRAIKNGKINIDAVDIRDYTTDKHGNVDDYIYGGGAGMLMQADPVYNAFTALSDNISKSADKKKIRCVYVTPQGAVFNQNMAADLAKEEDLVILCGHYEGIDERVLEEIVTDYVSIGDYVLTGGELAAMVMIDSISRLVPGVLHNESSAEKESFTGELLEYPQYSRPEVWHGKPVPKELLSGNPKTIESYRRERQIERTRERRPDMYARYLELESAGKRMQKADKFLNIDMAEHINRGIGKIMYADDFQIVLMNRACGTYYHTVLAKKGGSIDEKNLSDVTEFLKNAAKIIFHQGSEAKKYAQRLDFNLESPQHCFMYTQHEKLPISGLYASDGSPLKAGLNAGLFIRKLKDEDITLTDGFYGCIKEQDEAAALIKKGSMYGAFFDGNDNPLGLAGIKQDGSIGMLAVKEPYRKRHIGSALLTYVINSCLEEGVSPYGYVTSDNEPAKALLQKLGLCMSKTELFAGISRH